MSRIKYSAEYKRLKEIYRNPRDTWASVVFSSKEDRAAIVFGIMHGFIDDKCIVRENTGTVEGNASVFNFKPSTYPFTEKASNHFEYWKISVRNSMISEIGKFPIQLLNIVIGFIIGYLFKK